MAENQSVPTPELRAAVAEGAGGPRARAEEAESALGAWQAHARELTSRLERAERRVHSRLRDSKLGSADAPGGDEDGDEGGEPSSAESNLAATVASLVTRLEETERLAARLTSFGVRSGAVNQNANRQHVSREIPGDDSLRHDDVIAESSEPATPETRRARAPRRRLRWSGAVPRPLAREAAAVGTDGDTVSRRRVRGRRELRWRRRWRTRGGRRPSGAARPVRQRWNARGSWSGPLPPSWRRSKRTATKYVAS